MPPVSSERQAEAADDGYHHGDLRRALIQAGVELLRTEKAEALTLREVARRAGVSHAAPYRHFSDKQALLHAIAKEGFELLRAQLAATAAERVSAPIVRLKKLLKAYVSFGRMHPHHTQVMFGSGAQAKPADLGALALETFNVLARAVAEAMPGAGTRASDSAPAMALTLWAQAHGLLALAEHVDFSHVVPGADSAALVDESLDRIVDALFVGKGVAPPAC